jgi:hypothetical protein
METPMVDFLFALGQVLFIVGLLYGAFRAITYRQEDPEENACTAHIRFEEMHVWYVPAETSQNRLRRNREEQEITVPRDEHDKGGRHANA